MSKVLCFIGDSLTSGFGDPEALSWPGRLGASLAAAGKSQTIYNLGIRRNTSRAIAARWQSEVEARAFAGLKTCLIFSFGVVDCFEVNGELLLEPEQAMVHARSTLEGSADYDRIFVGPFPSGDEAVMARIKEHSKRMEGLCAELNIPFLDAYAGLTADDAYLADLRAADGIHPGAAGYAMIADMVAGWDAWRTWFRMD